MAVANVHTTLLSTYLGYRCPLRSFPFGYRFARQRTALSCPLKSKLGLVLSMMADFFSGQRYTFQTLNFRVASYSAFDRSSKHCHSLSNRLELTFLAGTLLLETTASSTVLSVVLTRNISFKRGKKGWKVHWGKLCTKNWSCKGKSRCLGYFVSHSGDSEVKQKKVAAQVKHRESMESVVSASMFLLMATGRGTVWGCDGRQCLVQTAFFFPTHCPLTARDGNFPSLSLLQMRPDTVG